MQRRESQPHLRIYVFRKAEHVAALGGANSPVATGPSINVLKQMMVDPPIMGGTEAAGRHWLCRTQRRHLELELLERIRVSQAQPVLEDMRALVAIGIVGNFIAVPGHGLYVRLL